MKSSRTYRRHHSALRRHRIPFGDIERQPPFSSCIRSDMVQPIREISQSICSWQISRKAPIDGTLSLLPL